MLETANITDHGIQDAMVVVPVDRPSSQTREGGLSDDACSREGGHGSQRGGNQYNRGGPPRCRQYWRRYYSDSPRNHQDGDGEEQPNAEEVGQNNDQWSQRRRPQRFYVDSTNQGVLTTNRREINKQKYTSMLWRLESMRQQSWVTLLERYHPYLQLIYVSCRRVTTSCNV